MDDTPTVVIGDDNTTVTIDDDPETIVVPEDVVAIVDVAAQGPPGAQGPAGDPGPAGSGDPYVHTQASASTTWMITHNLHHVPVVELLDDDGAEMWAELNFISDDVLVINFLTPASGKAILI